MDNGKAEPDVLQRRIAKLLTNSAAQSFGGIGNVRLGTDVGAVRKRNEDRALVAMASYAERPERGCLLAVVCDGMGGLADGDQAAILAASTFVTRVLRQGQKAAKPRLISAALAANADVYAHWSGRSGSTLSALMIEHSQSVYAINIGDSRIYGISSQNDAQQISIDDTIGGLLRREDDGKDNQLLQFVGMGEDVDPHFYNINDSNLQGFLLTSDGVHGSNQTAFNAIVKHASSQSEVIERLLAMSRFVGGRDNASAICLPREAPQNDPDIESGLSLRFFTASESLEIWSPSIKKELSASALLDAREVLSDRNDGQRINDNGRKRTKRAKAKSYQRDVKPKGDFARELPLEREMPGLDVRFPTRKTET